MAIAETDLLRALQAVVDPETGRDFVTAKQVKNLPGRPKRDRSDSSWLAQCFERGAVRPCFVPDPEFRVIRLHTRYRRDLTDERTREKNRTEKLLESAAIKLSSVVTEIRNFPSADA